MATKRCLECLSETAVRTNLYGMPMEETDPAIHKLGGFGVPESDPVTSYMNCGWDCDFINHLQTLGSTDLSI